MGMMRQRSVWTTNLTALLFGFGMFGLFILVPALVELPTSTGIGFGASVTKAGLFLVPSTTGMLLISPLAGRLASRIGSRIPLIAGAVLAGVAFLMLTFAHDRSWEIYTAAALFGVGLGLAYSSMANLIVAAVRPDQTGVATGMNTVMRTIGGAIGAQVTASVLAGSVSAAGLPTDHAFTLAFLVSAVGLLLAVAAATLIPRHTIANEAVDAVPLHEAA
jgi:MFS family permease